MSKRFREKIAVLKTRVEKQRGATLLFVVLFVVENLFGISIAGFAEIHAVSLAGWFLILLLFLSYNHFQNFHAEVTPVDQLLFFAVVVLNLILAGFSNQETFDYLKWNHVSDWRYSLSEAELDTNIAIILVESDSSSDGSALSFEIINTVLRQNPKVIGVDLDFPVSAADSAFLQALDDRLPIVVSSAMKSSPLREALLDRRISEVRRGKSNVGDYIGPAKYVSGWDSVVRTVTLHANSHAHFGLLVWLAASDGHLCQASPSKIEIAHFRTSSRTVPLHKGRLKITFSDPPYSYREMTNSSLNGEARLENKIVLIGTKEGEIDFVPSFPKGAQLHRTQITANVISALANGHYLRSPHPLLNLAIILSLLTLNMGHFVRHRGGSKKKLIPAWQYLGEVLAVLGLVLLTQWLFGWWFNLIYFMVGILITYVIFNIPVFVRPAWRLPIQLVKRLRIPARS